MSGNQKIFKVLERIKRESEINPNPDWVVFNFNTSIAGPGILNADQEKRILKKLEIEGVVELHVPNGRDEDEEAMLNSFTSDEFMLDHDVILVKVRPAFYRRYFWYGVLSLSENVWNLVNPFWLLWKLVWAIYYILEWAWLKSKILFGLISAFSVAIGLLVIDYTLALNNLTNILRFLHLI